MKNFTPPLFVFEGHDVSIFDSIDSLQVKLEGIDVEDGVYEDFDAVGRIVHFEASGVKRGRFWVEIGETHVRSVDPTPTGATPFYNLLADHLKSVECAFPKDATLGDLVSKCISREQPTR